jgi:hypothetical protein
MPFHAQYAFFARAWVLVLHDGPVGGGRRRLCRIVVLMTGSVNVR